ncbi:VWA domain-containing protein [Clostridium gasigenes]|uniref:vWA domain-containing protein n=1 Tax=Clostridium gasigenes TaxID=94869 RepID=UPI001C0B4BBE|nr:VWA domain-containing protein [Clostridium gasigenes]MBU3089693.1 VWA domain-containing protein [Clostridium gasigenes]
MRFQWKGSKENYNKKGFLKISSSLLLCIFILGLIVIPKSEPVSADEIKPKIDVTYLGSKPQEPMTGQDIEVRYQVTPQPFQYKIVKPKEIVLVLDGSGSMNDNNKIGNLKAAANAFIDKLKPVENLKIGIVVYNYIAKINPTENKSINENEYLLDVRDPRLKAVINNIKPYSQTGTGDGLRVGEFLLQKGDPNADKTLILMSDGEPTCYSIKKTGQYYEKIDGFNYLENSNEIDIRVDDYAYRGKSGLEYATTIGDIIKKKNHNIFSIGYGLGYANSSSNIKMQKIHTSMGGVVNKDPSDINNTFFASDEGAIESIFGKIADKLLKSYSINDVKVNAYLGSGLTAVDGFEVNGNNKDVISVPPIVYELTKINGEDWYTAKPIIITFKIKANEAGKYHIFDSNSKLEYTAVDGKKISIPITDDSIVIKKFAIEDSKKLQVDFYPEKSGYLMGDSAKVVAGFTKPEGDEFNFNNAKFDITNGIPIAIELKEGKPGLDFGTINDGVPTQQYSFNIKDNITESTNETTSHIINGKYSYIVKQDGSTAEISGSKDAAINIKRGSVLAEIVDINGEKINSGIKVSLQDTSTNSTFSTRESNEITNGIVKFNTIPTGNYKMTLTNIPAGYEFKNGKEAIVSVNYENNIAKYTFVLNDISSISVNPNININYKRSIPENPTVGENIDVDYEIVPESFKLSKSEREEIVLVLDGSNVNKLKVDANKFIQNLKTFMNGWHPEGILYNVKIGIVVYSSGANIYETNSSEILIDKDDGGFEKFINGIEPSKGENIGEGLKKAEYILTHPEKSSVNANKTVILMSELPTEYDMKMGSVIKDKGYNVFTIGYGLGNKDKEKKMKEIHSSMGGTDKTFFKSGTEVIGNIIEKMNSKESLQKYYRVNNLELKVRTGDAFDEVDGFGEGNNKAHTIKIPEIIYEKNEKNQQYEAKKIPKTFKIKANKPGEHYVFNETNENLMEYTNFKNEKISKKIPNHKINISDSIYEIKHGLYEGVKDNQIYISEENVTIAGGTNVNFGAEFTIKSTIPTIKLDIDKNYENIKNIKVYKLVEGKLVELGSEIVQGTDTTNEKSYKIVLPKGISTGTKILIRYSAKLPNSKKIEYINSIKVGSSLKNATVTTTDTDEKDRLPDLF